MKKIKSRKWLTDTLCRLSKKGISEKETFESRTERSEGARLADSWGCTFQEERTSPPSWGVGMLGMFEEQWGDQIAQDRVAGTQCGKPSVGKWEALINCRNSGEKGKRCTIGIGLDGQLNRRSEQRERTLCGWQISRLGKCIGVPRMERGTAGRAAHHEISFGPVESSVLMEIPVEMFCRRVCVCVCSVSGASEIRDISTLLRSSPDSHWTNFYWESNTMLDLGYRNKT